MLKKLIEKLGGLVSGRPAIDPSRFGDPLAERIGWTPAKGGGANFSTHKLVKVAPDRFEFRASIGAKLFYTLFLCVGIGVAIGSAGSRLTRGTFFLDSGLLVPFFIGIAFAAVGGFMFYFGTTPIVF